MLLFNWQLNQLSRARDMDQLIAVESISFDTEQDIPIAHRHKQHHRRFLASAESVLIGHDLHSAISISQICGGVGRDKYCGLGLNGRQKAIATSIDSLAALP